MLSYSWSYCFKDIVETLEDKCESSGRVPKRTCVWIRCLCNNQHRVDGHVLSEEFSHSRRKMWSVMTPWNHPEYLKRVWYIFSLTIQHACITREGHDIVTV